MRERRPAARQRRSRQRTSGLSRVMHRSARHAPSRTCAPMAARPSGARRRGRTVFAPTSRRYSAFRPRSSGSSFSTARDRTAPMEPIMWRLMRCSCRKPSAGPFACSGCGTTNTAGIRKARSSCSTCVLRSTMPDASSRGRRRCGCPTPRRGHARCCRPRARRFRRNTAPAPAPLRRTAILPMRPTTCASSRT